MHGIVQELVANMGVCIVCYVLTLMPYDLLYGDFICPKFMEFRNKKMPCAVDRQLVTEL